MTLLPSPQQRRWQAAEFGMFCHFGINTFYGKEWSDGTLDPRGFDPTDLDVRQWVDTALAAGMRYLILTAKHHDGFCLWPTETTDYSIRSSPYKNGNGDIVEELAVACREKGMPFGLYLSPWDRHEPCYEDAEAYDDFYIRQLTELCTRYGPLFELWFDGAGSHGRRYDWDRIMAVVATYQQDAMIFNVGRLTIRWAGNEDGVTTDPNYYVVAEETVSEFAHYTGRLEATPRYIPPECDVAIRRHWFWQPDDLETLKSKEELLAIYYRSVGLGANLLLNVPPNRDGVISPEDRTRLLEMTGELERRFAHPISATLSPLPEGGTIVEFDSAADFDHLILEEDLSEGQKIDGYRILRAEDNTLIAEGITVGNKKIHVFPLERERRRLRIEWKRPDARLIRVTGYQTGYEYPPVLGGKVDYTAWEQKADLPH